MSQHAIPLAETADLARFARRTTVVRIVLLVAISGGDRLLHLRELDAPGRRGDAARTRHERRRRARPLLQHGLGTAARDSRRAPPPRKCGRALRPRPVLRCRLRGTPARSDIGGAATVPPLLPPARAPACNRSPAPTAGSRARRRSHGARRRGHGRSGREPGSRPASRAPAGWCSRSRRGEATSCSSATSTTRCSTSPPSSRRCGATSATGSTSASWRSARPSRTAASS